MRVAVQGASFTRGQVRRDSKPWTYRCFEWHVVVEFTNQRRFEASTDIRFDAASGQ
jgi:hypothetical protein